MKKILLVNTNFTYGEITYGGLKKMLIWVGNGLAELGHDVTFCTIHDILRSEKLSEKAASLELGIVYHSNVLLRYFSLFTTVLRKMKSVLKNNYDYVISFGDLSYYVLLLLKPFYKYKIIVSERADPTHNNSIMDSFMRNVAFKKADIVVCQTDGAKSCFPIKVQRKAIVIPNPVDLPSIQWRPNQSLNIATTGRVHFWQKRQDILIKSFYNVVRQFKKCVLNVYGDGPDMDKLRVLVHDLQLDENVVLHGSTSDVKERLINNQIFVMTSDFEGIPNSLLEAMSLGMPVVSTDCSPGGARLLIKDKENGLLASCGDTKQIAEKIIFFIEHPEEATRMGVNARISMERFSPEKIINLWNTILI
jgi:GalNAc-alpha-(1->4)-GalNAc-alpha-(1->3)-diNAcBac-PP-undecaprenol alpha-1,4-N-acetyl-D-galactosaminyltransferase